MRKSINLSLIFIIFNLTFIFPQNSLDFDYFFKKYPKENRERFEKEILKFEEIDKKPLMMTIQSCLLVVLQLDYGIN